MGEAMVISGRLALTLLVSAVLLAGCAGGRPIIREASEQGETKEAHVFKGVRTVKYSVSDIEKAKLWYTEVLGFPPYFDQPFYVGFNVGGYELGLDPDTQEGAKGDTGVVAYWGVDDVDAAYRRLLELGAAEHQPIMDVGEGIRVGTVIDPFGNVFGVIYNPHFEVE